MKSSLILATFAALSLGAAQNAHACACCASKGTFRQSVGTLESYQSEQFFGRKIEGTLDVTSGENDITRTIYYTGTIDQNGLTLYLTGADSSPTGTLSVKLPSRMSFLETDKLGETQPDVTLYKQIVFRNRATTTDASLQNAVGYATVILKGEGNSCGWDMKEVILQTGKGDISLGGHGTLKVD